MIHQDLSHLEAQGNPILLGVNGAGWLGSGFAHAVSHVHGMEIKLIVDSDVESARAAFLSIGFQPHQIIETQSAGLAVDALRKGKVVISGSYSFAASIEDIDIVVDATPSPAIGAETAISCINFKKDVILINIEADVTVGRILKKLANEAGILYSVSSGDEPGCLMELYDFVKTLGYEPIVIGKGKNNPLNPKANPETVAESAKKADKDPNQVAFYVDGTKTMIEMTSAANATGCLPMKRGMVGPKADLSTITKIFALEEDGGIIKSPNTVDFVQGDAMSGGVFVTVRISDQRICSDLEYLKVGKGHYYTFFRPYHLWFLEAPTSIARAYLYRQTTLVPLDKPIADVITVAKKDIPAGTQLDDFGGYTFYGEIDTAENARALKALPVGLAPEARLINPVSSGQIITWDDVKLDESSKVVQLRRQQDNNII